MCRRKFQRNRTKLLKKTINILLKWIYLPNSKLNSFFIESVYLPIQKQYILYAMLKIKFLKTSYNSVSLTVKKLKLTFTFELRFISLVYLNQYSPIENNTKKYQAT